MGINWTEEIIARLTEHFKEGLTITESAAKLTAEFGIEFSRSAVVGKRHRWGLTCSVEAQRHQSRRSALKRHANKRAETGAPEPKRVRKPNSFTVTSPLTGLFVPGKELPKTPLPKEESPSDYVKLLKLDELEATSCRWPIGDPRKEDFGFCGATATPGQPYCAPHCARAYQPPQPRRYAPTVPRIPTIADLEKV